ncbi:hypothetical protein [Pseudomonas fluorescens]|uniref:hypothetical protein n=1 Tax=Pseudomonas fluorescens TaxID=294 RepID=UPI000F47386C|nr:hypothetical protein [Pseudomonas fluorescens]RON86788.1 hypothetical protein BK668_18695 [Pseudomonas fluorescens]
MSNSPIDLRLPQGFHQTSKIQPEDYQECLVYSPCEGFMIATWKQLNEDPPGFYLFATYEAMHPDQTLFWIELPSVDDMQCLVQSALVVEA